MDGSKSNTTANLVEIMLESGVRKPWTLKPRILGGISQEIFYVTVFRHPLQLEDDHSYEGEHEVLLPGLALLLHLDANPHSVEELDLPRAVRGGHGGLRRGRGWR